MERATGIPYFSVALFLATEAVLVFGVSVDKAGESVVKDFIKENGISHPVIINTKQLQEKYEEAIARPVRAIPTSLVVDRTGRIVSVHVGFIAKDVLEQEIQPQLGKNEKTPGMF